MRHGAGTLIDSSADAKTRAIGATDKRVAQHLGVAELRPPSLDLRELLSVPLEGRAPRDRIPDFCRWFQRLENFTPFLPIIGNPIDDRCIKRVLGGPAEFAY